MYSFEKLFRQHYSMTSCSSVRVILIPNDDLIFFHLDVKRSGLGLLVWVAVLTTWITIFQHFRAEWGAMGDSLSFTIPLGIP